MPSKKKTAHQRAAEAAEEAMPGWRALPPPTEVPAPVAGAVPGLTLEQLQAKSKRKAAAADPSEGEPEGAARLVKMAMGKAGGSASGPRETTVVMVGSTIVGRQG